MFGQIDTMRMARDLGAHAAQRQRVIATNVANADTPGYRARDLERFSDSYRQGAAIGLHARSLTFLHPIRYEQITLTAPLPPGWRGRFAYLFKGANL